ncbi:SDR family NAD(P)-dependent oxidoreductase [Sphingosinicella rhizophila]|uniref:SDR family NAD(P)-dependent oxidoreductase n=1 Tax=Sphingosinicella rhizophila TaxID=3050082 RepID=A0ABU3QC82_9SPHN|nr:SDR family NAD(P)-dependent oxidoreductase [Sphingosinicella sp. GR2756]MDT9600550.1 SDR family NAD(P)-dependent oxidoreductase [Sphingosinicella sp. GR2756]
MITLRDKHVVITGARGILGSAVAQCASELGARLSLVDLRATGEKEIGVDLADAAATLAALGRLEEVDILFHLAGGFAMGPAVHDPDPKMWENMFQINVTTLQNTVRSLVPGMIARRRGRIVTVGALSARQGAARMSAYIAAKSVVMRLTESLSAELKEHGINVNGVLPSIIDTPTNRHDMPDADPSRWWHPLTWQN